MKRYPIIILHGWGLSAKTFDPLALELEKMGYQVFVPELPGFGASKPLDRPYTLSDYARFIDGFCTGHRIKNPVVIGHSFGGRIALKYNVIKPGFIKALILSGTPGIPSVRPLKLMKLRLAKVVGKIGHTVFSLPVLSDFYDPLALWYYKQLGVRDFTRATGYLRDSFRSILAETLIPYFPKATMPVCLIWGEHDILAPVAIAQKMQTMMPNAKLLVIPKKDHSVPFLAPKVFAKEVAAFMESVW